MLENNLIALNELKPNETGIIREFNKDAAASILMEMGLLKGTTVEVIKFAPLRDPIEIRVRGFHLSIRRDQAKKILVEKIENV